VFKDRINGAKAAHLGLMAALDFARPGEVLVVWRLDRLGRSLNDLIELSARLENAGVGLQSVQEAIDATNGEKPVSAAAADSLQSSHLTDWEATLTRNGYDVKALASLRNIKPREARLVADYSGLMRPSFQIRQAQAPPDCCAWTG
jgi:hypothetical protein